MSALDDDRLIRELALARESCEPKRLGALVAEFTLSPAQCIEIGTALAELAERYVEEHEEEWDDDELDIDDHAEALRSQAAALLIEGGQPWELSVDTDHTLTAKPRPYIPLEWMVRCLENWEDEGGALLRPIETKLPWPHAAAREVALRLATEALAEALAAGAELRTLLEGMNELMQQARALPDLADGDAFERLRERLPQLYPSLGNDKRRAIAAAEEALTDAAANTRAYHLQAASVMFEIVDAALGRKPNFRQLFMGNLLYTGGRVGLRYPLGSLDLDLEQYYSWTHAGYDDLFGAEASLEAEVAARELETLLHAAVRACTRMNGAVAAW